MAVLVTRPSPLGEELVQQLNENGIKAWHTPLITFKPGDELPLLPHKLAALQDGDLVFAVSRQAVSYSNTKLLKQHVHWPTNLHYFAIGKATASLLHETTHCQVYYPKGREISEHLLELPELQSVQGKNMLVLRGNGGRELLAEQLSQRGASVVFCECYRREFIDYQPEPLITVWREQQIDTIILTSAEMLERIHQLFANQDIPSKHWLFERRLVVVSDRIALLAHQLGWHNIIVSSNADNVSLLTALKQT